MATAPWRRWLVHRRDDGIFWLGISPVGAVGAVVLSLCGWAAAVELAGWLLFMGAAGWYAWGVMRDEAKKRETAGPGKESRRRGEKENFAA